MSRTPNGIARIAVNRHWRGIAMKFGKDPDEVIIRERPARITKLRVFAELDIFDRFTGRYLGRFNPGIKIRRLLAYKLDGQDWIEVSTQKETV
jgi:hypothetical protein